jgi:hypothetical protein
VTPDLLDRAAQWTWRGRHWTDLAMGAYYGGWVTMGALTPLLDVQVAAFAMASAVLGAVALAALAARARRVEVVIMLGLTALTAAQAIALLTVGTHEADAAGVRLILAPFSMVAVAGWRHRETLLADLRARRDAGE